MARHAGTNDDLLTMALVGYEAQRAKIEAAIRDIQAQLGHRGPGRPTVETDGATPAKRTMSAGAARASRVEPKTFYDDSVLVATFF
jgi:hypothetical protein